jgi:CheY-like chemotaxis protein
MLAGFLVKPVTASMLLDAVTGARAALADPAGSPRPPAPVALQRLPGMRLLVVEDNPNNQQVARELLEDEGARVVVAANGQLGVEAVAAADPPFDAVLMDIQMPVMDGYTATARIRQTLGLADLPIIAMTANALVSDREACLAAGMNAHVGKPFDIADLVAVLLRHTGHSMAAAPPTRPAGEVLMPDVIAQAARCGFDLAGAIGRMAGKQRVYLRTLQSFAKDLPALPAQLTALLQQSRPAEAADLMHTYKGLAATLGMVRLAGVAADIERALAGAQTGDGQQDLGTQLSAAVAAALPDIAEVAAALDRPVQRDQAAQGLQADPAELRRALDELGRLLGSADMRALDVFEQLQQTHAAQLPQALDEAMAALDFDLAGVLCRSLQRGLDA